ncbi:metastasis suppressor protein 1-like isoform X2 [Mizuhopecten yessoensis]|uniref:metastasis suppressor protein 1-like isoform X2 n=1 Tax=Mizuhopecten yessoensis TaxID=6573 RepID=UPI000B45CA06|nr:metastasis suppressor protein 1-like isoform X2 [Mizuhopecten yessoensis]
MESIDKDCTVLGGLFQIIVNDMRGSSFIWEDFTCKAAKLHSSLKATLGAIGAFLDAFQKVADMATGSRGATKDIGSALTRLCMRHRTIEAKLKSLTLSIVDNLVNPLQEKGEDWKKTVAQLDKEHAKEYKRARQEIKKAASDTMRLQKKVKKSTGKNDMQIKLDSAMQDVNDKYLLLEETEKTAVRNALIEERGRFCIFIGCLRPFVEHEIGLLTEITHLQEIMDGLCYGASEPDKLPTASEQCIIDMKGQDTTTWNFQQQSPPSSPSSLGSRKSSMCSINSINSSSSGSLKSHSPSHLTRNRNSVQHPKVGDVVRLTSVSSQDSGFTSQDTLFLRPATPNSLSIRQKVADSRSAGSDTPEDTTPSDNTPSASSTWTTWPNPPNPGAKPEAQRPHTISSAYEKSQKRPALSSKLFEPLLQEGDDQPLEQPVLRHERSNSTSDSVNPYLRPQSATINKLQPMLPPLAPKPKSRAVAPPKLPIAGDSQALYVNLTDLANMAVEQQKDQGTDSDITPTERSPPATMSEQIKQNSLELAEAIKELEASTAALQSTYDMPSMASQNSLQCSSGYSTMDSTPAGSKDTIASGDYDLTTELDYVPEIEKYYTIPRNSEIGNVYRQLQAMRPASLAGIPVSGSQVARRPSMNPPKPPPPVRRSSSISTAAAPPIVQRLRKTPPRDMAHKVHPPASSGHRRSSSSGGLSEPAYADLQTIQQSIQSRHQQQNQLLQANPYATTGTQHITLSAPPTPSQHMPQPLPHGGINNQRGQHPLSRQIVNPHCKRVGGTDAPTDPPPGIPGIGLKKQGNAPSSPPPNMDVDLPPPPTEWELEEIEKVYSCPPPIKPKPHSQGENPENVRASLLSELKLGPKLRRVTSTDDGSEC